MKIAEAQTINKKIFDTSTYIIGTGICLIDADYVNVMHLIHYIANENKVILISTIPMYLNIMLFTLFVESKISKIRSKFHSV